jgi:uncharacterized protein (TIGR02466 family)
MNEKRVVSETGQITAKAAIKDLFATPVGVFEWPCPERLNNELRSVIMARYNTSPGLVSSNRKGWHSTFDMHRWQEPCVGELMSMVKAGAQQMSAHFVDGADKGMSENWKIKSCWSNVNPPGGYNQPHHHIAGNTLLSGFYYVDIGDCPDPKFAGRTVFQDRSGVAQPKRCSSDPLSREYAIVPKPGVMALFPAAQYHYVEPYRGNSLRISVAFNLENPDLDVLYYPDMLEQEWWWKNFRGLMLLKSKIPEKTRALMRFGSYFVDELRRPRQKAPFLRRVRVTLDRAEADEAEARLAAGGKAKSDAPLPEKRSLV